MTNSGSQSILDALRSDHRSIIAMLDDPGATDADDEGSLATREQAVMEMVRHFVAEEQYLDPLVREKLDNGAAQADQSFAADRASERQLKRLEDDDLTADGLKTLWSQIQTTFHAHVEQQEAWFTALAASCDPAELNALGDEVLGAEQLAPTRPRRVATSSPRLNKLSSIVEGYIDHVRDAYSKRGVDPTDEI